MAINAFGKIFLQFDWETITTPIEKPQALGSWCIVKTTYVLDGVADETC